MQEVFKPSEVTFLPVLQKDSTKKKLTRDETAFSVCLVDPPGLEPGLF